MDRVQVHLPDFLFVGTAKAGTTSIYNYLSQHPQIEIPRKESFYFIRKSYPDTLLPYPKQRKGTEVIRDLDELSEIYSSIPQDKLVGEVGTGYLYNFEQAIPEIVDLLGREAKILIVLRNPVERTYSGYMHFKKYSFNLGPLRKEIDDEERRRNENYDFMWQFSGLSFYADAVKAYKEVFPNVRVLFFEDLQKDPDSFMTNILNFLDISEPFKFDSSRSFNPSGEPKSNTLQKLVTGDYYLKRMLRPIYHKIFGKGRIHRIRDGIRDSNLERKGIADEDRAYLEELFKPDIEELQKVLGDSVDLSEKWRIGQA